MLKCAQYKRKILENDNDYTGEIFPNGRKKRTVNKKYAKALNIHIGQVEM